jgi:hypothetical protein
VHQVIPLVGVQQREETRDVCGLCVCVRVYIYVYVYVYVCVCVCVCVCLFACGMCMVISVCVAGWHERAKAALVTQHTEGRYCELTGAGNHHLL